MNGYCHLQGVSKEMLSVYEMASQSSIFKLLIKIALRYMLLISQIWFFVVEIYERICLSW